MPSSTPNSKSFQHIRDGGESIPPQQRVAKPCRIPRVPRPMSEQHTCSTDFEPIRLLGKGSFGAVILVKKRAGDYSGEFFAMKVMKKRWLADKNAVNVARVEREILAVLRHPYLVSLCYAFQSRSRLYLVTEYLEGGSLDARLRLSGPLDETCASVSTAQLMLAIEHLHALGVIHRDIKAANVLFTHAGDACLADFGLAAYCDDAARRTSFSGTVEYMAPELFRKSQRGYTAAIDWWSLGCVMYEMMSGETPFRARTPRQLFENVLRAEPVFCRPNFSDTFVCCVSSLLERNVERRADANVLRRSPFLADTIQACEQKIVVVSPTACSSKSIRRHFDRTTSDEVDHKIRESARQYLSEDGSKLSIPRNLRADAFAGFAFCRLAHPEDPDPLTALSQRHIDKPEEPAHNEIQTSFPTTPAPTSKRFMSPTSRLRNNLGSARKRVGAASFFFRSSTRRAITQSASHYSDESTGS